MAVGESESHGGALAAAIAGPLMDALPTAAYVCDLDGIIVRYNPKAAELWGRAPRPGDRDQRFCGSLRLFRPDGERLPHGETPMADVLARGEPAADREVVIERPDGSRVWALVNIAPLRDRTGRLLGAVNCFQDITARKQAESAARESRDFLDKVIETTPECVKLVAGDGRLLRMNAAGLRMVEADSLDEVRGRDTLELVAPADRARWHRQHQRVCAGETLSWEFEIVGLKGTRRYMESHAVPLALPEGSVAQLAVTRDVTRHKQAGAHQQLLIRELNHRVKNTLATVQSIARHSLRGAESPEAFRETFGARLMALSKAHDLLTRRQWEGAALSALLEQEFAPYWGGAGSAAGPGGEGRVVLEGPEVPLSARQALVLAMAFHELATNAAKYGALSTEEGRLEIHWTVESAEDPAGDSPGQIVLRWRERGGPKVEPPTRRGFGSRLIERSVPGDLAGEVRLDYRPEGLCCAMRFPLGASDVLH